MKSIGRSKRRSKRGHPVPYRRRDGRWAMTLDLGRRVDGRRWRLPVYGRSSDEVLKRAPAVRARATSAETRFDERTTLAEYAAHWIDALRPTWNEDGRRTGLKHSSWRGYEKHVRLSIIPTELGRTRLDRLTSRMVREWRDYLGSDDRGLGPRSVGYALVTLQMCLDHAKDESELIPANPARGVKPPPQQNNFEARIFTLSEARRFLEVIRDHPDEAIHLVSVFAGPRQGETLSLREPDYDAATGVIRFIHTLDWIEGKASIEENKTSTSRRSVRLPKYVVDAIARHRAQADLHRDEAAWVEYGLLFPGEKGQPLRGSTVYRRLQALLREHDLPILRWHDLRHSSASILLALGVPMQVVQRLLGHSSLAMISKRYGHLVPELAAAEIAKVEQALLDFDDTQDPLVDVSEATDSLVQGFSPVPLQAEESASCFDPTGCRSGSACAH
jgi:integrase